MRKIRTLLLPVALVLLPGPGRAAGGPSPALMSDRVLSALQRMAAWGAPVLGEPGPGPDFIESSRRYFIEHPPSPATAAVLVRAEEDYPCLDRGLARMSPAERARWVQRLRPVVDNNDNKPLVLASAMSGFASQECRAEQGHASLRGMQARMAQQTIMFNMVAMQNTWRRYNMNQMARAFGNAN